MSGSFDGTVRIWDPRQSTETASLQPSTTTTPASNNHANSHIRISHSKCIEAHAEAVVSVDCHPTQPQILSGSMDGMVRVWDMFSQQCLLTFHDTNKVPVSHCKYSKNGKYVVCSTLNSNHSLWNVDGIHPVNTSGAGIFPMQAEHSSTFASNAIVTATTSTSIYKMQSNSALPFHGIRRRYSGHVNKVYNIHTAIAGSSARGYLCSGSEDNGVYIWDMNPTLGAGSVATAVGGAVLPYKRLLAHSGENLLLFTYTNMYCIIFYIPY